MAPTRWGIIGTGRIAHDFTNALTMLSPSDHQVVAVAARERYKAEEFANRFSIPKAYGGYSHLIADCNIDVVYVAVIIPYHFDVCKNLIEAGKSVLCEKPVSPLLEQTTLLINLAKEKGVFFQEGFWSVFFPVYKKLHETVASGSLGEIKVIEVGFALPMDSQRTKGGAMLDLGCYTVMLAQLVFKEKPEEIMASSVLDEHGRDVCTFSTLNYSGGRIANISCHEGIRMSNTAHIYGTKGSIQIPTFWCPDSIVINDEKYEFPIPKSPRPTKTLHSEGFVYQAESVRQCLLKGERENPLMTHEQTLDTMLIVSTILNQIGYKQLS